MKWKREQRLRDDPQALILAIGCLIVGFLVAALIFGKPWHLPPNWGDIPTWLAVTVASAAGWIALVQLRIRQQQIKEQGELLRRDAEDRRREQAANVFIGVPYDPARQVHPYAQNSSKYPIFDVKLWLGNASGVRSFDEVGILMPDKLMSSSMPMSEKEAIEGTVLTFRDANGVRWARMPQGAVEEQGSGVTAQESAAAAIALASRTLG